MLGHHRTTASILVLAILFTLAAGVASASDHGVPRDRDADAVWSGGAEVAPQNDPETVDPDPSGFEADWRDRLASVLIEWIVLEIPAIVPGG